MKPLIKRNSCYIIPEKKQFTETEKRLLQDSLLLVEQDELIKNIAQNVQKNMFNKTSTLWSEISDLSFQMPELPPRLQHSYSCIEPNKNSMILLQDDAQENLRESLIEIKSRCSRKTYNLVRDRFYCQSEWAKSEKKLERQVRHNQQLINRIQRLTKEKIQLQSKISHFQERSNCGRRLKTEKVMIQDHILQKQAKMIKLQRSIIQKQKAGLDYKKFLTKQLHLIEQTKKQNQQLKQQITKIADKILKSHSLKDHHSQKQLKGLLEGNKRKVEKMEKEQENLIKEFYDELTQIVHNLKKQAFVSKKTG